MITCALLINQACQENYEMVDPPLITGTDDLDEEVINEFVAEYQYAGILNHQEIFLNWLIESLVS